MELNYIVILNFIKDNQYQIGQDITNKVKISQAALVGFQCHKSEDTP